MIGNEKNLNTNAKCLLDSENIFLFVLTGLLASL